MKFTFEFYTFNPELNGKCVGIYLKNLSLKHFTDRN